MRLRGNPALSGRLSVLVLIALTLFVSAVRPITRPSGRLYVSLGLTRMSLITESPRDDDTPLPAPSPAAELIAPPLLAGILLLVLKTRRCARRSVPFRRLRLPPRRTTGTIFSD